MKLNRYKLIIEKSFILRVITNVGPFTKCLNYYAQSLQNNDTQVDTDRSFGTVPKVYLTSVLL